MIGTYIAAYYVGSDWSMSFIVPGFIMGLLGFVIFMFLVDSPDLVGMQHEVTASNPDPATNHRRIDDSDDSDAEQDALVRTENAEHVSCTILSYLVRLVISACFACESIKYLLLITDFVGCRKVIRH